MSIAIDLTVFYSLIAFVLIFVYFPFLNDLFIYLTNKESIKKGLHRQIINNKLIYI